MKIVQTYTTSTDVEQDIADLREIDSHEVAFVAGGISSSNYSSAPVGGGSDGYGGGRRNP